MQIKDIKIFFAAGLISKLELRPAVLQKGWTLSYMAPSLGGENELTTALGDVKVFSSLDTAFGQVAQITGRPVQSALLVV